MVETFEAMAAAALMLLPGALYVWGFERQVGNWGIGLSDRVLRFFGTSALIHVTIAPLTYWLWATAVADGDVAAGGPLSPWIWLALIGYVSIPFLVGRSVGRATRNGSAWAEAFTGPNPAPRAWDHFFASRPDGWVRLRLKSGSWVGGLFKSSSVGPASGLSYASGYPEVQDLYFAETIEVDPETGEVFLEDDRPIYRGLALLIRWDEVELLEFRESWR